MDKNLLKVFNKEVLASFIKDNYAIIIDSQGGHKNFKLYENILFEADCLIIPPGCTPLVQLLNFYFYSQLKIIIKNYRTTI